MPTAIYSLLLERADSLLGPRMARATPRLQCELCGVDPEQLGEEQLDQVLKELQMVLHIYVGRTVAEQWVRSVRSGHARVPAAQRASAW